VTVYSFDGAFRNLNSAIAGLGDAYEERRKRQTLADIGTALQSGDYAGAQSLALKAGELNAGLKLAEMAQNRADTAAFNKGFEGLLSGGGSTLGSLGTGSSVQVQPSQTGGASLANLGNPNQIETRFMSGIREAGLTNPYGLATVAAYGKRESGWSPQNANRSWSDPSQSGQAGTSGGLFAWRNERLRNLYGFAQQRGENIGSITPETQAAFLASEDPTLIPRLNNAKSVAEANRIMADAWRFAGYQGNSPEYNARLQTAMAYLPRYQGDGNTIQRATGQPQPTMVAQAQTGATTPDMARAAIARVDMLLNDRELTPQQRQSLEQRRERYVQVAQQGQTPQQQADTPAQGAMEAQQAFVIPGTGETIPAGTRITPRAANMMRMLSMNVPESRKEAIKILLQEELKASNPATQLDLEGKRLSNEKARRELEGGQPLRQAQDRAQAAEQFGLQRGTPEYNRFVLTGQLPTDSAPTTRNIKQADGSEVVVQWDAARKDWVPLPAPEGGNAVRPQGMKLTEGQSKDLVYYNRGEQALREFEPIGSSYASGMERLASERLPFGNYAVSEQYQKAQQSGLNFLASILRKDTGAAITKEEQSQYGAIFLPQPGDAPGTLQQKALARRQALDAIKTGLGPAQVLAIGSQVVNGGQRQQGPAALDDARSAIARGAPREAVIQRLRQNGIDPAGL